MLKHAIILGLVGFLPLAGQAATVSTIAVADTSVAGTTVNFIDSNSFDTNVDALGSSFADASPPTGEGVARSNSYFDNAGEAMHASAVARKNPGTTESVQAAQSAASISDQYEAIGAGTVTASLRLFGRIAVLTDIADPQQFARVNASLGINAPGTVQSAGYTSAAQPDPLFLASGGVFDVVLDIVFDVNDGDVFSLNAGIASFAGKLAIFSAFFDAGSEINSFLSVTGDGTRLVPTDGSVPGEVPLPASILFLGTPLAFLGLLRRRRKGA